jgi:ABC-type sugar transport system ATPase subunit
VSSNIFLGREHTYSPITRFPRFMDDKRMEKDATELLHRLRIEIRSVRLRVESLSGGQRQSVAIARATAFQARVVIMDEPTAALAVREVSKVLDLIRGLHEHGVAVILISHRLQDVFAVCNRIMVLRHGSVAGEQVTSATSMDEIVALMVGAKGAACEEAQSVARAG